MTHFSVAWPESPLSEAVAQRKLKFSPDPVRAGVERSKSCKIPRPGRSEAPQTSDAAPAGMWLFTNLD